MANRRVGRSVVWLAALTATVLALGREDLVGHQGSGTAPARPRTTAEHVAQMPSAPPPPFHLPEVGAEPEPLPEPSIQEPFEIGEALYDEARVPEAVVSLVSKMGIPILPDGAAASPPANGLRLDASEVRALIALARDDLASATDIENLPYTFADLHAALAPMLPGQSVEALADAYSRAYAENESALAAKVMMGQPITPETRLTRAHIWLLVMDGFASPGVAAWGTADRMLPDLPSPNPQWSPAEWKEVLARLPLVGADRVLAVEAPATIAQGAAPVSIVARLKPQAAPLVSRITGKTLLAPAKGSLTGQAITWDVAEDSVLRDVGELGTPTGDAQPIGADGVARLRYAPAADTSKGQGQAMEEWADVAGTLTARPLLASAYTVPSAVGNLVFGTTRFTKRVRVTWRSSDTYILLLSNLYQDVEVIIPPFGKGTRSGTDSLMGYLAKRRDGRYQAVLEVHSDSNMQVPSPDCKSSSIDARQLLLVVGRPVDGFGPAHKLFNYAWLEAGKEVRSMQAEPPVGYMALEFYPVSTPQPRFAGATAFDKCQPLIPAAPSQRGHGATAFQPLNDARWTTPGSGYVVALGRYGRGTYLERTMDNASSLAGATPNYGPKIADADTPSWVGVFARGYSEWLVWVRRPQR